MAVRINQNQQQFLDQLRMGDWRTQQIPNRLPPSTGPTFPTGTPGDGGAPMTRPRTDIDVNVSNRNGLLNSLMSPEAIAAIGMGGLGFASGIMGSRANASEGRLTREQHNRELLAAQSGDALEDMRLRQQGYMNTLQQDPVSQARALFSANMLRDLAGHGSSRVAPGQGVTNPFSVSPESMNFLSPDALADNASRFYSAAGSLDPNQQRPDLAAMGFGDAGAARQGGVDSTIQSAADRYEKLRRQQREDLLNTISTPSGGPLSPVEAARQTQQNMRGGGTSKIRKILGLVGAAASVGAAPFTGGYSLAGVGPSLQLGFGSGSKTAQIGSLAGSAYGSYANPGSGDYFNRRR